VNATARELNEEQDIETLEGNEPFAKPITRYMQSEHWAEPRADRVLVAVSEATILGFGAWTLADSLPTWKSAPPVSWEPTPWIRIPRFGVDVRFQGQCLDGIKYADRLYAAVEADIRESPRTNTEMFIDLFVDAANARAMSFWQRQRFRDVGTSEGNPRYRRYIRYPWPSP
jgi:ribosomal protein S18 acetylase RimI-like enzyme